MQKNNRRKERGQGLVEFALTLPILMMFLMGILDFGRVLFTYSEVSNNLRTALRQAPNIGYSGTPSYLDCTKMKDIADNASLTTVSPVTVTYHLNNNVTQKPCTNTGDVLDTDVANGDFIEIKSHANLKMWVLPAIVIQLDFTGQRTIIKTLALGSGDRSADTDLDGLVDTWEITYFGNTTAENALGDYDCDLTLNGAEEALGTNPTTVNICP
jgi:hypothetical protein